jgi:hypothetical protein
MKPLSPEPTPCTRTPKCWGGARPSVWSLPDVWNEFTSEGGLTTGTGPHSGVGCLFRACTGVMKP